jgi:hypothetical protein
MTFQVIEAKTRGWDFLVFRKVLWKQFVPSCLFTELRCERYERLSVIGNRFLIMLIISERPPKLPVSDGEVVSIIIAGLNPVQRTRFFSHNPNVL